MMCRLAMCSREIIWFQMAQNLPFCSPIRSGVNLAPFRVPSSFALPPSSSLQFVGWCDTRIVFVESFCRTKSLSVTGRLLYPFACRFIVQWEELVDRYPRAECFGFLI